MCMYIYTHIHIVYTHISHCYTHTQKEREREQWEIQNYFNTSEMYLTCKNKHQAVPGI